MVTLRLVNQLDGQLVLLGRRHELVDGPVQPRVILAGPNYQQGRQRRVRLQVAQRPIAEGGAADPLGRAGQDHGGQHHPGRERGHADPFRVDAQVARVLTDGGQGGLDFGDDRLEPRVEDGAVLEGDPGHALVRQQPAPAGVLAPAPHPAEQLWVGLAVDQQHRRHPRSGCPPGWQVYVHGQLAAVGVGVHQVRPHLDPVGIGQGMDQRLGRVEPCHGADPTGPAAAPSGEWCGRGGWCASRD